MSRFQCASNVLDYITNDCMPALEDGRVFTSYTPNCTMNSILINTNNIETSNGYRKFLTANATKIMNKDRQIAEKRTECHQL